MRAYYLGFCSEPHNIDVVICVQVHRTLPIPVENFCSPGASYQKEVCVSSGDPGVMNARDLSPPEPGLPVMKTLVMDLHETVQGLMDAGVVFGRVIDLGAMRRSEMSSGVILCEMIPGETNLGALFPCQRKASRVPFKSSRLWSLAKVLRFW
jgi:hypothetical protein